MDTMNGTQQGFRMVLKWYGNPVGLAFAGGLLLACVLAVFGALEVAFVVQALVLAAVVPWKLVRQRDEYLAQVAALHEAHAGMQSASDSATAELARRIDSALTKKSLRPILQEFRRADRDRINGLQAQIVQIKDDIAPAEPDEDDVSAT